MCGCVLAIEGNFIRGRQPCGINGHRHLFDQEIAEPRKNAICRTQSEKKQYRRARRFEEGIGIRLVRRARDVSLRWPIKQLRYLIVLVKGVGGSLEAMITEFHDS